MRKPVVVSAIALMAIAAVLLMVYRTMDSRSELEVATEEERQEPTEKMNDEVKEEMSMDKIEAELPEGETIAVGKLPPNGNPLVAHKFGADPYVLVYKDRVYVYATYDQFEHDADGNVKDNTYAKINKLSVISSDDLMNWTDHGAVHAAGPDGAAKWATQSWAPAAAHKVIDGKDKFFLYFANNASGIGVLSSDSPTGPWVDPIGKPLIARSSPAAQGVTWLFDPAVFVDDDGRAYIYFGGGIPEGQDAMPNTGRVMELGADMISVVGEAAAIPAPFMFESAGINKVNGTYYYTYCSNFYNGVRPEGSPPAGEIAYMTSDSPMGPWTYQDTILKNPGHFFGVGGNNHHVMFQLHDTWYIAYHAQTLSKAMGVPRGYRSTHLNQVVFQEDGTIQKVEADMRGVEQLKPLDPYTRVEAETMAWSAGIEVEPHGSDEGSYGKMAVTGIENGDWIAVAKVDFGSGASAIQAAVQSLSGSGQIELRLDGLDGQLIGTLSTPAAGSAEEWVVASQEVAGAAGVHDLYFVFRGQPEEPLFKFDWWQFTK
jgi:arabinoxylan arabinofuranohydrolase